MQSKESLKQNTYNHLFSQIMSAEEYAKCREEFSDVYVVDIEHGCKRLVFFGALHENDPSHPQFEGIKKKIDEIQPDLLLVEGMHGVGERQERFKEYFKGKTFEEVVQMHGESIGTLYLALTSSIEVSSPEPSDHEVIAGLLKQGFSRESIYLQQILRMVPQWAGTGKSASLEDYLKHVRFEMLEELGMNVAEDMYEQIISLASSIGISLTSADIQDPQKMSELTDPIPWSEKKMTEVNNVSNACGVIRDRNILVALDTAFKTHDTVFAVYGSSHAHMLEGALKSLVNSV